MKINIGNTMKIAKRQFIQYILYQKTSKNLVLKFCFFYCVNMSIFIKYH